MMMEKAELETVVTIEIYYKQILLNVQQGCYLGASILPEIVINLTD